MLVGALLTLMFVAVVQLAISLHVRNVLVDAASEGARYGALSGRGPDEAAARARELVTAALNSRYAADVAAGSEPVAGGSVVVVEITAPLPVIGLFGPRTVHVSGHALQEGP